MEKTMEELIYMHDQLFKKFAPHGRLQNFRKEGEDTYVILYIDDADEATPFKTYHMNKDGLYDGHCETSMFWASLYFMGEDLCGRPL